MEKNIKPVINPEDITIVFCVPGGYVWAKLAIESFKYTNPDYKDRVVVFNDNSSIVRRLEKHVSKIITWKNFERNKDMLVRVSEMYQDCAMQIDTKYICFIDCDTISFRHNWLNDFLSHKKPEDKICTTLTHSIKKKVQLEKFPKEYEQWNDETIHRFTYFLIVLDNEYFKKNLNINAYYGKSKYYKDDMFDIGTEMYYFCVKNNIPFYHEITEDVSDTYLLHVSPNPNNPQSITVDNDVYIDTIELRTEYKKRFKLEPAYLKAKQIASELGYDLDKLYSLI